MTSQPANTIHHEMNIWTIYNKITKTFTVNFDNINKKGSFLFVLPLFYSGINLEPFKINGVIDTEIDALPTLCAVVENAGRLHCCCKPSLKILQKKPNAFNANKPERYKKYSPFYSAYPLFTCLFFVQQIYVYDGVKNELFCALGSTKPGSCQDIFCSLKIAFMFGQPRSDTQIVFQFTF